MRMESSNSQSRNNFGFKRSKNNKGNDVGGVENARDQLTFQTASNASGSGTPWGHNKSINWDDKTQLQSYTFGNVRPGGGGGEQGGDGGLNSIDESSMVFGESSLGSIGEIGEVIELPELGKQRKGVTVEDEEDEEEEKRRRNENDQREFSYAK